jgi:alanine-synthesizing transaminase
MTASTAKAIAPARKIGSIKYAVRDVLIVADEAKRAGKEMLYLNIGDPNIFDYETPPVIVEAIVKALRDGRNGYAPSDGVPEAIAAIRADAEAKGIRQIQNVFVASGCSEGIEIALSALCNEGENILTPSPGYPLYTALVAKLGLTPNAYQLDEDQGWQPDLADMEAHVDAKTRAIVLINPNNPTGSVCSRRTLEGVIDLARRHDLLIIADEIYGALTLDGMAHIPLASIDPDAPVVTFDGLSKAFLGPGLRIGWGILSGAPAAMAGYKAAVAQLLRARISANHPEQYAIAPALADKSHQKELIAKITRRRDLTVEMLNAIPGISCVPPRGAFYAFPRLAVDPAQEEAFVAGLIRETGVVVVHGSGFGQRAGSAHFRVVYLPPEDVLRKAYTRIGEFFQEWTRRVAAGR